MKRIDEMMAHAIANAEVAQGKIDKIRSGETESGEVRTSLLVLETYTELAKTQALVVLAYYAHINPTIDVNLDSSKIMQVEVRS